MKPYLTGAGRYLAIRILVPSVYVYADSIRCTCLPVYESFACKVTPSKTTIQAF